MQALAVVIEAPERLSLRPLDLAPLGEADVLVEIAWSGISSGTEKLLWTGRMPAFPGMGYPLVPGYESVGRIVEAGRLAWGRIGEWVFVPGANCFDGARGLFGGSANRVILPSARAIPAPQHIGSDGILLALAATAHHAIAGGAPDLVIGHGVLGRLIARVTIATGAPAPTIWEIEPGRRHDGDRIAIDEAADERRDYARICDASGAADMVDIAMSRLAKGGEITLAGFYDRVSFAFPPAFMREARIRIAAEFTPADLAAVIALVADGSLRLDGLVSHIRPAESAQTAYPAAFGDSECLKMALDWSGCA